MKETYVSCSETMTPRTIRERGLFLSHGRVPKQKIMHSTSFETNEMCMRDERAGRTSSIFIPKSGTQVEAVSYWRTT